MNSASRKGIGMTSERTRRRLIDRLRSEGISNSRVLEAIAATPRHLFLDEALGSHAYDDTALPIGFNQTISQPYVVAIMTEAILHPGCHKVLEIGTGSGYQAAVLARLVDTVYTVERIRPLLDAAVERFQKLDIRNVYCRHRDGFEGLPEHAPYDGILVTAAPAEIPQALLAQLGEGGRLVIPVGDRYAQDLRVITRHGDEFEERRLERVRFVPMLDGLS
ncbi:MAG: protein-L-isoaspartate(D-aspartate) O-methyltransferase [Gammaproteobacteria bacterium]|jgi:protein-L-isoaspartate(D-aspartate) O-methyltransferase|nr:protein-L-isoaspartate(D-aspartate) O-methyltransferase [Gammaproteobacteria bacterium]